MNQGNLERYLSQIEKELKTNILPFWAYKTPDKENGGYYGSILNDLTIDPHAPKGSVLCSRILWTFSRAHAIFGDKLYLDRAVRAYRYLTDNFIDNNYGGVYWTVDYKGKPLETKKQIYAQAFAVYALSEYYNASGSSKALSLAKDIFRLIEKFGFEEQYSGYYDACRRDWSSASDMKLGEGDMNAPKTMNTSLHILEAYTNLILYWNNRYLRSQLKDLINVIITHILNPSTYHFKLFFNIEWESFSDIISYGHDIEGSWLLMEAADVLGEKPLIETIKKISVKMAEITLKEGMAPDGGLYYEGNRKGVTKLNTDWWPQAEAVVGFLNAYQLSGRGDFLKAALDSWDFIMKFLIDKKHGEWFWSVDKNRKANQKLEKVGLWKCPYHNTRACIEAGARLSNVINLYNTT